MHVLLLGPYPPPHGGVQTNLVAIRGLLLERGVPCSVINLTRHRQPDHDGIHYPHGILQFLRLFFRLKFSVVHLHIGGNLTPRLLGLALLCSALRGVKTVLTLHSGGYPGSMQGRSSHPRMFRARVFRRIDRLIAVNEELRNLFVRQFGADGRKVRLILPHSLPAAVPDVVLPGPVKKFLECHDQILLSIGWLEPEYDFALQMDALGRVRERLPHTGLLILGEGRLETELRAHAASKPYAEHILLAGDLPHEMALAAIARATVFLRTTHYDGDSISVREARHFGTPVIASDTGMRPAGVRLVAARDRDALADAIIAELGAERAPRPVVAPSRDNIEEVLRLYEELT